MGKSLIDSFDFELFGQSNDSKVPKFNGYVSSIDPTTAGIGVLIGGSQNTYLSILGTICNRDGLKRRGPADSTAAGVVRSYEWETSLGITRVLRATNGKLQVEFDAGSGLQWYDLLTGLTTEEMNFSFSPWYSPSLQQDELIFVNGQQELNMWAGGVGIIASASDVAGVISSIQAPNTTNGPPYGISAGGIGYVVGDVLTISGGNGDAQLGVDSVAAGGVASVAINNAGASYAVGDTVKIGSVGSGFAILKITTVDGSGHVTGLSIVANGIGYSTSSATATIALSATGTGLTVDVTSVGNTISAWHFVNNGSGYSTANSVTTTGGTGTGATVSIVLVTAGRITFSGSESATELGFAGSLAPSDGVNQFHGGQVIINGVTYSYLALGDNGQSLIGIDGDPSMVGGVALNTVVVSTQTASGNTFAKVFGAKFSCDFVNTIGNQLHVGCYSARPIFISADDNYLDFAVPVLRAPGDADVITLDSNARGATSKTGQKGNAVLFGSLGDSYSVTRTQQVFTSADAETSFIYELDAIDKATSADLSSPQDQNFIDSIGDTIIFLDQNNQLRQFGTLRNLSTPVYPILSLDVYTEFANTDFTGGELRAVSEQSGETVYITVPLTGTLWLYQIREKVDEVGNLTSQRLWQTPFIVGASTVAVIEGITYIYSNSNPQTYQLWDTGQFSDDSPSDTPLPYECHAIFAYISLGDRTKFLFFDKLYYEGYMTRGTTLYNNIYQEYQGAKNVVTVTVNKPINPGMKLARFYDSTSTPSLGDISLGEIPLGEGVSGRGIQTRNIPKFRAMRRTQAADMFEFALDIASYDLDCQWEILVIGVNIQQTTRQPTGIMA